MEIAVAAASPLGQYLAELDVEGGGESMAQLLTAAHPAAAKRPTRLRASSSCSWRQLIDALRRRVELLAARRLIPQLRAFHPTIREELQQTGADAAVFAERRAVGGCWWRRKVVVVELLSGVQVAAEETRRLVAVALMVLVAAVLLARMENVGVLAGWSCALAGVVVLGLELGVRGLLAWYARRSRMLVASLNALGKDPNYTVIFTGTSIGDEGFDLQALLRQQEADASATSSPTPYFVRELRDVLAHRQAHAQPGLTKQIDHDPPVLSLSVVTTAPAPPPADTMFSLPRAPPRGRPRRQPPAPLGPIKKNERSRSAATAFKSELQALLQRAQPIQQQDVLESLGDSDDSEAEKA
ncbi:hypothetical protein PR001_g5239 [Phytophthora rubi]|uniref:Uncharacterized protein n=1 Tax=Phytophthora rubi TaxID=129364 RepID=A0A6A3NWD6_9STRA|nr:hypothetical protein PR001_g5239 [Phytophthora rubi]